MIKIAFIALLLGVPVFAQPVVAQQPEKTWEISESGSKVTEKNTVFWKYSWRVVIRNFGYETIVVQTTVEFQDSQGYIIDEGTSRPTRVLAQDYAEITGTTLVKTDAAPNITQTSTKARQVQ